VGSSGIRLLRNIWDRAAGEDVAFLLSSFDRAGPDVPDGANGLIGIGTQLDKQPSCDRPRATKTTAAMDEHPAAASNSRAQIGTSGGPPGLELTIGHGNINDRQVNPAHCVLFDHAWEIYDFEELELPGLDQRHDHFRSPVAYCHNIDVEITMPSGVLVFFARTQGQADNARRARRGDFTSVDVWGRVATGTVTVGRQYSSARITVMTRWVTDGSLGSGE
jgi:hypothetical protein